MSNFEKLLGDALGRATPSEADTDLNAIITEASTAINALVPGAELRLTAVRKDMGGTLYALSLMSGPGGKQGPLIEGILVPSTGYPIAVGALLDLSAGVMVLAPGTRQDFADRAALDDHVGHLLSHPSSPVLQHLAFLRRIQQPR